MTLQLRKTHLLVWSCLLVALPWTGYKAWQYRKQVPYSEPVRITASALPLLIQQYEREGWVVGLRTDSLKIKAQLEILIKKPLSLPSVVVVFNQQPLGRLGSKGLYRFEIDTLLARNTVQIVDEIREEALFNAEIQN